MTMCPPGYCHNGFMTTPQLGHVGKFLLQNWFSRQITLVSKSDILFILQRRQDPKLQHAFATKSQPQPPAKLVG